MPGTRKLGRPTASRLAMLRAMVTFLLEKGRIETTVTRAKEVRSMTEKMITIAKDPTLANKRLVFSFVTKESVAKSCSTKSRRNMPTGTAAIPDHQDRRPPRRRRRDGDHRIGEISC